MADQIHYLGIRHHGPGSARRVVQALTEVSPSAVLIEGPMDADPLLARLADQQMQPPVALLAYDVKQPQLASFDPFAEYSPEYQAIRWALEHDRSVQFIDLASSVRMALRDSAQDTDDDQGPDPHEQDPIGRIAQAAGYVDGESWWNDWLENTGGAIQVFDAVAELMTQLRQPEPATTARGAATDGRRDIEAVREAHMRRRIAAARRAHAGDLVVVCGAWHVPALRAKHSAAADRALLTGLPKRKAALSWVPWTGPRLASDHYGAGVIAPQWYSHLWQHDDPERSATAWLVQIAGILREAGRDVSTASVIDAVRLATSLAGLRGRPVPGFEEVRDAVIAAMFGGEEVLWHRHGSAIRLGTDVGAVPPGSGAVPLLDDLQREQRRLRLRPEAQPRDLSLDLRSDSGAGRSRLLHRLRLLDVDWGVRQDPGGSRGTFRERWLVQWQPELSVQLIENLVYGTTIEQASANRSVSRMTESSGLAPLTDLIQSCLEADLPDAAQRGLDLLDERVVHTQQAGALLDALPALVGLHRYGTARQLSLGHVGTLIDRLLVRGAVALPTASRQLDEEESLHLARTVEAVDTALDLAQVPVESIEVWWRALAEVRDGEGCDVRLRAVSARLTHDSDRYPAPDLVVLMRRMLSPGLDTTESARFFEGFFTGSVRRLIHDAALREVVDEWLGAVPPEVFTEQLPLLRRVTAELDLAERRRLLDAVLREGDSAANGWIVDEVGRAQWPDLARELLVRLGASQ